jgi:hypothetical protein
VTYTAVRGVILSGQAVLDLNTVNRAPMDAEGPRKDPEIVFTHLMEGIGLALDVPGGRMVVTAFGGSVYHARLDGSDRTTLAFALGNLTGIAYVEGPRRAKRA